MSERLSRAQRKLIEKKERKGMASSKQDGVLSAIGRRGLFAAGGLVILGGVSLAARACLGSTDLSQFIGYPDKNLEDISNHLKDLEDLVRQDSSRFGKYVSEILGLSAKCYSLYMKAKGFTGEKYNNDQITKNSHPLDHKGYVAKILESEQCLNEDISNGFTHYFTSDMYFDLDVNFFADQRFTRPRSNPTLNLFMTGVHESHHSTAVLIGLDQIPRLYPGGTQPIAADYRRGLRDSATYTALFNPPRECRIFFRSETDESVVQLFTNNVLRAINRQAIVTGYDQDIFRYQNFILRSFFDGDETKVLNIQQSSDVSQFLSVIGQKLGAPASLAEARGDEYVYQVMNRKQTPS